LGEGCHFVDLACFAAASAPVRVHAEALDRPGRRGGTQDFLIMLRFANGATATIEYLSSSNGRVAKEHLEFHRSGVTAIVRDYLEAEVYRGGRTSRKKWGSRDKGHRAEMAEFLAAVKAGGPTPIPEPESIQSMFATLLASRSIAEGRPIAVASA
jgi:predicted dehydrogenase